MTDVVSKCALLAINVGALLLGLQISARSNAALIDHGIPLTNDVVGGSADGQALILHGDLRAR